MRELEVGNHCDLSVPHVGRIHLEKEGEYHFVSMSSCKYSKTEVKTSKVVRKSAAPPSRIHGASGDSTASSGSGDPGNAGPRHHATRLVEQGLPRPGVLKRPRGKSGTPAAI